MAEKKAENEDYRVMITGIHLKDGSLAKGRTVVKGDKIIDLDKALENGYVALESEAKKAEAKGDTSLEDLPLTAAQKKAKEKAEKEAAAEKELSDAKLEYTEKFFSDVPEKATLVQIKEAIATDKPIEA